MTRNEKYITTSCKLGYRVENVRKIPTYTICHEKIKQKRKKKTYNKMKLNLLIKDDKTKKLKIEIVTNFKQNYYSK